jgi:hypothetical protein
MTVPRGIVGTVLLVIGFGVLGWASNAATVPTPAARIGLGNDGLGAGQHAPGALARGPHQPD